MTIKDLLSCKFFTEALLQPDHEDALYIDKDLTKKLKKRSVETAAAAAAAPASRPGALGHLAAEQSVDAAPAEHGGSRALLRRAALLCSPAG